MAIREGFFGRYDDRDHYGARLPSMVVRRSNIRDAAVAAVQARGLTARKDGQAFWDAIDGIYKPKLAAEQADHDAAMARLKELGFNFNNGTPDKGAAEAYLAKFAGEVPRLILEKWFYI